MPANSAVQANCAMLWLCPTKHVMSETLQNWSKTANSQRQFMLLWLKARKGNFTSLSAHGPALIVENWRVGLGAGGRFCPWNNFEVSIVLERLDITMDTHIAQRLCHKNVKIVNIQFYVTASVAARHGDGRLYRVNFGQICCCETYLWSFLRHDARSLCDRNLPTSSREFTSIQLVVLVVCMLGKTLVRIDASWNQALVFFARVEVSLYHSLCSLQGHALWPRSEIPSCRAFGLEVGALDSWNQQLSSRSLNLFLYHLTTLKKQFVRSDQLPAACTF